MTFSKNKFFDLLPYEIEALTEALRRDMRSERLKAETDPFWSTWHESNVRMNIRILDAINPKRRVMQSLLNKEVLSDHLHLTQDSNKLLP